MMQSFHQKNLEDVASCNAFHAERGRRHDAAASKLPRRHEADLSLPSDGWAR
jgi:hypothetical protein